PRAAVGFKQHIKNTTMKLGLLFALILPVTSFAHDAPVVTGSTDYPNTYSSGSADVSNFDNSARRFNDWSISVGGGTALMLKSDLTSVDGDESNWGWNAYASIDKQISHTVGLSLQYQMGESRQRGQLPGAAG